MSEETNVAIESHNRMLELVKKVQEDKVSMDRATSEIRTYALVSIADSLAEIATQLENIDGYLRRR